MFLEFLATLVASPFVALNFDLNLIEVAILLVGWFFRRKLLHASWIEALQRSLRPLYSRPWRAILLIAAAAPVLRLLLLPIHPVPVPVIADEFSHLLLGNTYFHGRWTNPVHPLWVHLESIHILQTPSYNSMYFPGQGALLAVGMLLGHPWIAVLLSGALLCGGVVWALQAWMPQRWALCAGLLAVLRFGVVSYWMNSYWGGALGAFGGCLIVGSFGRLRRRVSLAQGLLMGLGLGILACTRPLEGLVFATAVGCSVIAEFGWPLRWRVGMFKAAAACGVLAATCVCAAGYHFYKVTGDPMKPPYVVNREQYGWPMALPWQKVLPVQHSHKEMKQYFEWERKELAKKSSPAAFATNYPVPAIRLWSFYLGPALTLALFWTWRRRWTGVRIKPLLLWATAAFVICSLEFGYPHYYSPATVCVLGMTAHSLRTLRLWRRETGEGLARYRLVMASVVAVALIAFVRPPISGAAAREKAGYLSWCCLEDVGRDRVEVAAAVKARPGKHVIFASSCHEKFNSIEWVYNGADIDGGDVVWVRDMGVEKNRDVLDYYPGRTFWEVNADESPPEVKPYRGTRPKSSNSPLAKSR